MADVSATFMSKVKMNLRVTSDAFDAQIQDLIDEAILDLTKTSDIETFSVDSLDALQAGAVVAYIKYKWFNEEKFFKSYNDMKQKMALSSYYRGDSDDE